MASPVSQFEIVNGAQLALLVIPPIFFALASIAVGLRWYARSLRRINSLVEDVFCLAGFLMIFLVVATLYVIVFLCGEGLSMAQVISTGRPLVMLWWNRTQFAVDVCWATSITAIQLSLLNCYVRIFHSRRTLRTVCYTLMAIIVGWYVLSLVVWIIHCHHAIPPRTPTCTMQSRTACIVGGFIHVTFDLSIMIVGIPALLDTPSSFPKSLSLAGLFSLGLFCTACAILRMDCIIPFFGADRNTDPISASWGRMLVSPLEIAVGIICCCIPNLSPLRDGWRDQRRCTQKNQATGLRRLKFRNNSHRSSTSNLPIFVGETFGGVNAVVSAEEGARARNQVRSFTLQDIKVTKEYTIHSKS